MKKKLLIGTAAAFLAFSLGSTVLFSRQNSLFNIVNGTLDHDTNCWWNHYEYRAPTSTDPGCKEYWICCEHHTPVFTKPTVGQNINAATQPVSDEVINYLKSNTDDPRYLAPASGLKTAVFADVQLCSPTSGTGYVENLGTTVNAASALKSHLILCKENNVDVLFMNGDIANNAIEKYYEHYQLIFESVYGTDPSEYPEIIWNMGNHEWWDKDEHDTANAVSLFNQYANIESEYLVRKSIVRYKLDDTVTIPSYYKVVKGIPFVVISGESSAGDIGNTLKSEIAGWLREIEDLPSVQAGGPIYVAYHCPISTTLTHGSGSVSANASVVEELLEDYPTAVLFTGDTHYSGINERAINQVNFTAINIGSSSYSRMDTKSATMTGDDHFYNMVVSGSKIKDQMSGNANYRSEYTPTIHLMDTLSDFTTKINRYFSNEDVEKVQHTGKTWTIPAGVTKSTFTYTNNRFENTESAQDLYGKNGLNWASSAEVKFNVIDDQMTVSFPDVVDYHYCEHFKITVTSNTSNSKVYDVVSNYYKYSRTPETLYFALKDLPSGDSYTVSVTAYDYFDNPSTNNLVSSTPTENYGIEPRDDAIDATYCDISHRVNIEDTVDGNGSSLEYYYKGIHPFNYGAILNRLYSTSGTGANDYMSVGTGSNVQTVVTMKVKNLDSEAMKVGITVVNGAGQWKSDFHVEYQVEIPANSDWTLVEWDLSELFGIHGRNDMQQVGIKASSKSMPTTGYDMHFLIDDLDITGEGPAPRGEGFTAGSDKDIYIPDTSTSSGSITIDIKFTSGADTTIAFILLNKSNWSNWIGYFEIKGNGTKKDGGSYDGVTITALDDGYYRIVIDFTTVSKISGTKPSMVNEVYVRGTWTSASGYIDVNPTEGGEPVSYRGRAINGNSGTAIDLKGDDIVSIDGNLVIDFKFTTGASSTFRFILGQGWSKYFGYFVLYGDGTLGSSYNGVSVETLTDGYFRVTFNLSEVTKVEDMPKPDEYINLLYFAGGTASGYIDF